MQLAELPEQVISAQLGSDERLLWSGRPRQGIYLKPSDAYLIPFSLMWGGFAIFWEYNVLTLKGPSALAIWGIPFVLLGLYLIFGRFFVEAHQRSRTYYGITNQRVIIVSGFGSRAVKSLQLRTLSDISLAERPNGSGTITFGANAPTWPGTTGWPGSSQHQTPAFESIPGARDIFERIRLAQREA